MNTHSKISDTISNDDARKALELNTKHGTDLGNTHGLFRENEISPCGK